MPSTQTDRLAGLTTSVAVKAPCRLKTTANHALSGLAAIDGVIPVEADRILVGSNTDATENGIYWATAGEWVRALDFNGSLDAVGGTQVSVVAGSTNDGTYWRVVGNGAIDIGTDEIEFEPGAASAAGGVTFDPGGVGAVLRSAQDKLRELWVSVKDYGATGLGVADDTVAINQAVDALSDGKTLYFPVGTYKVSVSDGVEKAITPIPVGCNVYMERGAWLTTDTVTGDADDGILTFLTPLGDNILQVNIDGNGYPLTGGVRGTWRNEVTAIRCYESALYGIDAQRVTVINSELKNCRTGIRADGAKHWLVFGNRVHKTQLSAMLFGYWLAHDCLHNIVTNNLFEDHGDTAVAFFQVTDKAAGGYCLFNTVANSTAKNTNQLDLGTGYAFDVELGDPDFQQHISFSNLIVEQEAISGATHNRGATTMGGVRNGRVTGITTTSYRNAAQDVAVNMLKCVGGVVDQYTLEGFGGPAINTDGSDGVVVGGNGTIIDCGGAAGNTPVIRVSLEFDTRNITVNIPKIIVTTDHAFRANEAAVGVLANAGVRFDNIKIVGGGAENPIDIGVAVIADATERGRNVEISGVSLMGRSGGGAYFNQAGIQARYIDNLKINNVGLDPQAGTLVYGFDLRNNAGVTVDGADVLGGTITNLFWLVGTTGARISNQRTWPGATVTNLVFADPGAADDYGTGTIFGDNVDKAPLQNAADDAAAAALTAPPVPIGAPYRNGSVLMVRVA